MKLRSPVKPLKVLDIGCGEGKDAVFLARNGYIVTVFDLSANGIEKGKRLIESAGEKMSDTKTLYVTDLDGTLMRDDKTISDVSVAILNHLLSQGICLTYATARSLNSASKITREISFNLPVILRNGTIIANPQSKREIEISIFGEELQDIRQILADNVLPGFATAYLEGKEVKLCLARKMNEGFQDYLQNHSDGKRLRMVNTEDKLYEGKTCYFTFIAPKDELQPLYERVKKVKGINCVFQQDKYRPEYWLEICPQNATKATAIQRVKELCGCQKVIVFGDSVNDIPMFYMADEAYATKNAIDELKAIATGIIGDNNSDGVAKWLKANQHMLHPFRSC